MNARHTLIKAAFALVAICSIIAIAAPALAQDSGYMDVKALKTRAHKAIEVNRAPDKAPTQTDPITVTHAAGFSGTITVLIDGIAYVIEEGQTITVYLNGPTGDLCVWECFWLDPGWDCHYDCYVGVAGTDYTVIDAGLPEGLTFIPPPPTVNLAVISFSGPSTAVQFEDITSQIDVWVHNSSPLDLGPVTVDIVLATDALLTEHVSRLSRTEVPLIGAGQTVPIPLDPTTVGLTGGSHFLGVRVDPANMIPEDDENDNTMSQAITIVPDPNEITAYYEDFQEGASGWVPRDLTEQDVYWTRMDYNDGVTDRGVWWCGDDNPLWVSPPGYGNRWNQHLTKAYALSDTAPVAMSVTFQHDVEQGYDFVKIGVSNDGGATFSELRSYDGASAGFINDVVDLSAYAGQYVQIRFTVNSDGAWSDQDGLWDSDGALRLDEVHVSGYAPNQFEATSKDPTGGWVASAEPPVGGEFRLEEEPVCEAPDPIGTEPGYCEETGAGHPTCNAWVAYNPKTLEFPTGGSLNDGDPLPMEIAIESPVIDIPSDGEQFYIAYDIYMDMPRDQGIFYYEQVAIPADGIFRDAFFGLMYGDQQEWYRIHRDISSLVPPGATTMKIRLIAIDMESVWGGMYVNRVYPMSTAPIFDNIAVRVWGSSETWPDLSYYPRECGASLDDVDGDGVANAVDICPSENAAYFDSDGDGCIDEVIGGRHVEYWSLADLPLGYYIHEDGAPGITDGSDFAAIQAGFDAWTNVAGADVTITYLGTTSNPVANALDGINTVTFFDDEFDFPPGVLAVGISTSFKWPKDFAGETKRPGQIVDTDMIFNPAIKFRTPSMGYGTYIQGVATHEAGHMIGISHSAVKTSTMFWILPPDDGASSLATEDERALAKAYPEAGLVGGTGRISGTVLDGDTGLPVPGAAVFVIDPAGPDTTGCEYTLPEDGSFDFAGLPDGSYYVSIHPLNGTSPVGFIQPRNINAMIRLNAVTNFVPESWDLVESANDDPAARDLVAVTAGTITTANFVTNIDVTGPSVAAVSPWPGQTGVAIDAAVIIKFDEAVDGNSLTGNFRWERVSDGVHVPGNAALVNDDSALAYITYENLQFGTEYRLELGAAITDLYGNEMGAPYIMTVTTEIAPPVALSNLAPSKGQAGSIVAISGFGFDADPAQNVVHFGSDILTVIDAAPKQLIVGIPPGSTPGVAAIVVDNLATGFTSNVLNFIVLQPATQARSVETAAVTHLGLPRDLLLTRDGRYAFVATDEGLTAVVVDAGSADYLSHTPVGITGGINHIGLTPDGSVVWAVSALNEKLYRFNADPGSSPIGPLNEIELETVPRGITIDRAGRRAFIPASGGEILIWDIQESSATFERQIGSIASPDPGLTGVMAVEPAGRYLLALSSAGAVAVFDLSNYSHVTDVAVGPDPRDIAIDPTGKRAYITDAGGTVTIVSLSSMAAVQTITTGGSLEGCAITAAGSFLYVANYQLDDLDVIDLRENSPTYRMIARRIPQRANPVDISFSADGLYAYTIIESEEQLVVTAMGEGALLSSVSPPAAPEGAVVSLGGTGFTAGGQTTVSFNGVSATPVTLTDNSIVVTVPAGAESGPVSVVGTTPGSPPAVSNAVHFEVLAPTGDGAMKLAAWGGLAAGPPLNDALAVFPDGNTVAVGGEDGHVYLFDTHTGSPTFHTVTLDAPVFPTTIADLEVTPDGTTALMSSEAESYLSIFDVDPLSQGYGTVKNLIVFGGAGLRDIAISPDGRYALVGEPDTRVVHVADLTALTYTTTTLLEAIPGLNGWADEMAYHPGGAFAYLTIRDNTPAVIVVLDTNPESATFGAVTGTVELPAGTPPEVPLSLDVTPDGSKCYVLTTQFSGTPNRTVVTLDTSDPAAPVVAAAVTFANTEYVLEERIRVSPRGDRAILHLNNDGLHNLDLTAPSGLPVLDLVGAPGDDGLVKFEFSPDGEKLYALVHRDNDIGIYDFTAAQEMVTVFGDGQTGVTGEPLASPLRVRVIDAVTGDGSPGVPVTFEVLAGGGHFAFEGDPGATPVQLVVATNEWGYAQVDWTLGPALGGQQVQASALGIAGSPRLFDATAISDPELLPLQLASIVPEDALTGVSTTTAILAAFSRPVDTGTPLESFFLTDDGGVTQVPTIRGFAADNRNVSLTPIAPLAHNTTYQVILTAGIVDENGGAFADPQITVFSTGPPPPLELAAVYPPSGTATIGVVLSGSGFDPAYENNTVWFDAIEVTPTDGSLDYLNVNVPVGAQSGFVRVVTNGETSQAVPFHVLVPSTSGDDEVVATVKTGSATKAVTVSPDGAMGYAVAPAADLLIPIDLRTFTTLPGIPVGLRPWAVTVHPDGRTAYVINKYSGDMSIIDTDPASPGYHKVTGSVEVGSAPIDLVVTGAGDRVIVANASSNDLSVIDSDRSSESYNHVVATVKTGTATKAVTVSPDGGRIYVGTDDGYIVVESLDYGVVATVSTGKGTKTITVSPDGGLLILLDALGDVLVFDVVPNSESENQVIATVKTGSGAKGVTVSPDGALLFLVENEGDQILVVPLNVPTSVSVMEAPDAAIGPVELTPIATLTAGENPQMVAFDPTGNGLFYVPNAGDFTISVFDKAPEPQGPGVLAGRITAECTGSGVGLIAIEVDIFSNATGDMLVSMLTDEFGYYAAEVQKGDHTVSVVTPLGFTIASEESLVTITPEETTTVDFVLVCEANPPAPRKTAFWKHQLGIALLGHGHYDVDGPTLCGYLDQIVTHFNNHRMNPVVVYNPPPSGECDDKLQIAKDLFNLKGNLTEFDKARSQFMALLFNVASGKLNLWEIISVDNVKVSKAITYIDILLQDGDESNDQFARKLARDINHGILIGPGIVPEDLPDIQYAPENLEWDLAQNYPNPFNPVTTIRYEIKEATHVKLNVYDVAGRLVRTLVDETRKPDRYKAVWNGTNARGQNVATGVYFYRLEAGSFVSTKKMVLLK